MGFGTSIFRVGSGQKILTRFAMSSHVGRNNFPITPLDFFVMKNYYDWKIISPHMTLITPLDFFLVIGEYSNPKL